MAAQIARSRGDLPGAIAYLSEAVRHSEIVGDTHAIPEFQSELSDLYRLTGDLSQAEVLARRAAESAQALGYIPLIPKLLNVLAQIQVSRKEYAEADQTYDRAATIQDVMIGNADSALGKTALIKGVGDLYEKHFGLIAEQGGDPDKGFRRSRAGSRTSDDRSSDVRRQDLRPRLWLRKRISHGCACN